MSVHRLRMFAAAALVSLFPACSGDESDPAAEIPLWPASLEVRVGSVDDPATTLTWFRSMEVGRDGRMYTLHPMEQEVRVFGADGSPAGAIGGRGDGPGEMQNAGTLGWVGDTLWILDFNGYRFKQFSPDGAFLGSFAVPFGIVDDRDAIQPPRADGLLADGSIHGSPPAFSRQIQDGTITHHRPMLMARDGTVTDTLLPIPVGRNQWAVSDPDRPDRGAMYTFQPFADGPLWGYAPGERAQIVLERGAAPSTESATWVLTKVTFEGDTVFSRRRSYVPRPMDQARIDSVLDATASRLAERGFLGVNAVGTLRAWAEAGLYRPAYQPPFTHMVLARDGRVWLREPPEGEEAGWIVLDGEGTPIARTLLPARFTIMVADGAFVWGSETDALDVSYVARYRVAPPG